MANPQKENGHIRIANELWDEVIRRDFSKRQKDIILFIWRLSYGVNQKTAYIPKLVYFELCGIGKNHIRKELEYLEHCKVIIWDKEERTFEVNKDYEQWQVSPVKSWFDYKFDELVHLNIRKSSQKGNKKVPEMGTKKFPKQELFQEEENEKFPKQELSSSQNGNNFSEKVPKTGTSTIENPLQDKALRDSKDIFITSIKTSSSSIDTHSDLEDIENNSSPLSNDFSFSRIYKIYEEHFTENGKVSEFEVEDLGDMVDTYGGEWVYEAMRECARHKAKNIAYLRSVLRGFDSRGGPHAQRDKPQSKHDPPKDKLVDARNREIALNRWIDAGGNPDEFVYRPTGSS